MIDRALRRGLRSLPGGSSLAKLLAHHRNVRNIRGLPDLSERVILVWAGACHRLTGKWPNRNSGPIPEAPGETWAFVDAALHNGSRGLKGGSSLAKLLAARRGIRNRMNLPKLRAQEIKVWIKAYKERHNRRPTHLSGPIPEAPGETFAGVHAALSRGYRGCAGGSSLFRFQEKHFGEVRYPRRSDRLGTRSHRHD
jgi:hypothetical protein